MGLKAETSQISTEMKHATAHQISGASTEDKARGKEECRGLRCQGTEIGKKRNGDPRGR